MSGIPPANIVTGVVQTTVAQQRRAEEKNVEERQKAQQNKEQVKLTDQKEHQVEDTLHTEDTRVKRHDEEESRRRNQYKYSSLPEDEPSNSTESDSEESEGHRLDLQA